VLSCFDFTSSKRNKIVASALDFPSMQYILDAQTPVGARVEMVPSDDGIVIPLERILDAIDHQTALVAISHVSFRSSYRVEVEAIMERARQHGALVLLDVKRGDIGSTSEAYAEAYLDPASPIAADAITVSPFLGFGSLDPFVDAARKHDAGLFVLARTSNKEAPEVQAARTDHGVSVTGTILDHLRALNAGAEPLGSFGAVVGATIGDTGEDFVFNGPILAPGYGAQGGTAADLPRIFGAALPAVLPSSSRELLRVGPDPAAMRDAARRTNDELRALLG